MNIKTRDNKILKHWFLKETGKTGKKNTTKKFRNKKNTTIIDTEKNIFNYKINICRNLTVLNSMKMHDFFKNIILKLLFKKYGCLYRTKPQKFSNFSEDYLLSYKQCYGGGSLPHQGRDSSYSASLHHKNNRDSPSDAKKEYKNMRLQSSLFHE